uniref:Permease n=1 Tax=Archaeoglobus fulgidus TaxID=2234 RepID=A0A7C3MA18_ARCFL
MRYGEASIVLSAILMGTVSIFVRNTGGDALSVTFVRLLFGFLVILPFCLRDIALPDRTLLGLALFNFTTIVSYITAIQNIEVAMAALLLYMAPVYVIPISMLMGEKVEVKTLLALPLGLTGLYLMLTPYTVLTSGIIFGAISGLSYALVFVLSKEARKKHSPFRINFYNLGLGSAVLLPYFILFGNVESIPWAIGLGVIPTAIPFLLFSYGMKYVKVQRAPVLALIEPLCAGVVGYLYFGEVLTLKQLIGGAMILAGVLIAWRE